ncbi:MAG: hypothetical protein ACK5MK_13780 [Dysgonomonas sp.]
MKNNILIIAILLFTVIGLSFSNSGNLSAQGARLPSSETLKAPGNSDMLNAGPPSDQFYSASVSPAALAGDNDDDLNPGGSEGGDGPFVGGIPVGDGVLPLTLIALAYLLFVAGKKLQKRSQN